MNVPGGITTRGASARARFGTNRNSEKASAVRANIDSTSVRSACVFMSPIIALHDVSGVHASGQV